MPPFVGVSSIQYNSEIVMERMLRKSNISALLKYPPSLLNKITENYCPHYKFPGSSVKYYRRIDIHLTVYKLSIMNISNYKSEELKSAVAIDDLSKLIKKEIRLPETK